MKPLCSSVPQAVRRDPALYDLLALVDALHVSWAREQSVAENKLCQRLNDYVSA